MRELPDLPARVRALTDLDATLVVEAAAGTGKTALIAGRVTLCLLNGVEPRAIAAITFSELAASELSARIHHFVEELRLGKMPECLAAALGDDLSAQQRAQLDAAAARLDELTVTTIHGFCQQVIHSYAVEADIDPGARMIDAPQASAAFDGVFHRWLRERLSAPRDSHDPIAAMSERDPLNVERHLRALARFRRDHRTAKAVHADLSRRLDDELDAAVALFQAWFIAQPVESGTGEVLAELSTLAQFYAGCLETQPDFRRLWELAHPPELRCTRKRSLELVPPRRRLAWQRLVGKVEGQSLAEEAERLFGSVNDCYRRLLGAIATALVEVLSTEIDEVLEQYASFKRQAAVLDFDDLLQKARALVRDHEGVRVALGERYRHILVDEFQDTDPTQAETLFRIAASVPADAWQDCTLRAGALFVVGDPKQAIYRFRGADVRSYIQARSTIERQWPANILQITANFRSVPGIIQYVNKHFEVVFDAPGQPEYVALTAMREPAAHGLPCVAKRTLDDLPPDPKVNDIRDAEAVAVAALCEQLLGNLRIPDRDGKLVRLRAGDIALLAPGGTELRRYERALEARGLPIACSAGKSLLHRQEVRDLIALARTLADSADSLAFGAFMRGPMVGLTEEELLDIADALPHEEGQIPHFNINTDPQAVVHPVARRTLQILRALRRRASLTTPALLLAEAAERFSLRPLLHAREGAERSRAVANIERFLELARAYDVTGLKSFVRDVTNEWAGENHERAEGRVDAEGAIEMVTMHSSKGLEWPVVILINSITGLRKPDSFIHRPDDNTVHWALGDVIPPELQTALIQENRIWANERQRVWYVACTRARELLIIPELPSVAHDTWSTVVDDPRSGIPELRIQQFRPQATRAVSADENAQTAEAFREEESAIEDASRTITWRRPSDEDPDRISMAETIVVDDAQAPEGPAPTGAGRVRGLVLHKLIEEVLTGELFEEPGMLAQRAAQLSAQLMGSGESGARPSAEEMARTVLRTLSLPEIALLRPNLLPELAIYHLDKTDHTLEPMAGRGDAVAIEDERATVVLDWKSDIAPDLEDIRLHAVQLRDYMRALQAPRGALVYMSSGSIHWIEDTQ